MIRAVILSVVLAVPLWAQTRELDLTPAPTWVDTNIDLTAGDTLKITATGQLQYSNARQANAAAGLPRGFADLVRVMQLNDAGRGALLGRIGDSAAARPFLIGESLSYKAPIAGRLFIAINQTSMDQATGSYHVVIERTAAITKGECKWF